MWPFLNHSTSCACVHCTPSTSLCYSGPNLPNTGIQNNDTITVALQKIDNEFGSITTTTTTTVAPYKIYRALLTQTGTNIPTAIVLENTIGNIVWSRPVQGAYMGILIGAFTTNATSILNNVTGHFSVASYSASVDSVILSTRNFTGGAIDSAMTNMTIEIKVEI